MIGHVVFAAAVAVAALLPSGIGGSVVHFSQRGGQENTGAQQQKVCLPNQWSSSMFLLDSINTGAISYWYVQMDYAKNQQAVQNYTGNLETPVNKIVIDFAKKMLYYVPTKDPSICFKTPIDLPMIQCIPEDAEYLGSSYLGPMGAGQLPYDGWRFRAPMGKSSVVYTLAVSKTGSVPLVEGVAYPDKPSQNQLFVYSQFQPKLTVPSVFDLPPSCQK